MLVGLTPRRYQETIFATATSGNTLVVLPTGLGKTAIFLMMAVHRLQLYPESKIIFLGPTRPLIEQYRSVFLRHTKFSEEELVIFTGMIRPEKRKELWEDARIIFSTPQGLENDVLGGKISLRNVSLIGFDESHRAVGEYAYVFLAKEYMRQGKYPRILALTASPGTDTETIKEVCANLHIEHIEVRSKEDPDIKPYIQETKVETIYVNLPPSMKKIQATLKEVYTRKLQEAKNLGVIKQISLSVNKVELLKMQRALHLSISQGEKDFAAFKTISLLAEALKVQHALELVETQSIDTLFAFMKKLQAEAQEGKTKSVKNLVADVGFITAFGLTLTARENGEQHPKLASVVDIIQGTLQQKANAKIIVFTQYRDSGTTILGLLHAEKIKSKLFVGQAKKKSTGLSQKEQKSMIEAFANEEFNVLVSSSVGEEGLDIPVVDMVIFFEPIPSAIRKIQRSGRTGRSEEGKVVVLITKGTRDEAYHWVAYHKESRMYRVLKEVRKELHLPPQKPPQQVLQSFDEKPVHIIADYREKGSPVLKGLKEKGVQLDLQAIPSGDYALSDDAVIEYKTVPDFVDSLIDGRLFSQLHALQQRHRPMLLIEGEEDIYAQRKVHPNALRGLLASLLLDYRMPVLQTKNAKETVELLIALAKREQKEGATTYTKRIGKPLTKKERQEFIVSSFPGVGPALSKPLLNQFKSIQKIANASVKELQAIDLIGPKKAQQIKDILETEYSEED